MILNYSFTIILLIIIIYLLILIYKIYDNTNNIINYDNCKQNILFHYKLYKNIKDNIKSGDIILFLPYDCYSIARLCNNITFQHYGIIIKFNNILYILECTTDLLLNNKKHGPNIYCTEFENRLLTYPGNILISHLKNKLSELQEDKLIKFAKKCIKYKDNIDKYTYLSNLHIYLNMYHNINFNKKKLFTCMGFIHYIYHNKLDIIKYTTNPNNLCQFYYNIILFGNIFEYPYEIIHNNLYINEIQNNSMILHNIL